MEHKTKVGDWTVRMGDEGPGNDMEYPEPTKQDLENPVFNGIWESIKGWDISRYNNGIYSGPTGNDVMHILNKIHEPPELELKEDEPVETLCDLQDAMSQVEQLRSQLDFERRSHQTLSDSETEQWEAYGARLQKALDESVKLQAHYAKLINMHDGGQRRVFKTSDEWIARLEETGTLP